LSSEHVERRLAADVAGSCRLIGIDEEGALAQLRALRKARGCLPWLVYRDLGLKFVSQSWLNLDANWALNLVLVGAVALAFNLAQ
jgi:hypothetical protein